MTPEMKEALKAEGLEFAEESVKDLAENAFNTLKAIIKVTENKYDDMALPIIELGEKAVMPLIDKINKAD